MVFRTGAIAVVDPWPPNAGAGAAAFGRPNVVAGAEKLGWLNLLAEVVLPELPNWPSGAGFWLGCAVEG